MMPNLMVVVVVAVPVGCVIHDEHYDLDDDLNVVAVDDDDDDDDENCDDGVDDVVYDDGSMVSDILHLMPI